MILSEKITELRKKAGLSQEEFGAEIGVRVEQGSAGGTAVVIIQRKTIVASDSGAIVATNPVGAVRGIRVAPGVVTEV